MKNNLIIISIVICLAMFSGHLLSQDIVWINIPAGNFQMGDNFNIGNSGERPVHTVYLSAYKISKYEVTFDQYDAFCDDTGRSKPGDEGWGRGSRPVINVTWYDAKAFCDWMSQKTGKNIHLPTEAQWEKAAKGTDQRMYPWGNSSPDCSKVNYYTYPNCHAVQTEPVGLHPSGASPYGVHNMAGNVWEWCSDWYSGTYYSISPTNNPQGPTTGSLRIMRGGAYFSTEWELRAASRPHTDPSMKIDIGFRIVDESIQPSTITIDSKNWDVIQGIVITGRVLDSNGNPVNSESVGVEDPILEQSRGNAATTNANGEFSYTIDTNYVEPKIYTFVFYAGESGNVTNKVTISVASPSNPDVTLNNFTIDVGVNGSGSLGPNEMLLNKKLSTLDNISLMLEISLQFNNAIPNSETLKTLISDPEVQIAAISTALCLIPTVVTQKVACPVAINYSQKVIIKNVIIEPAKRIITNLVNSGKITQSKGQELIIAIDSADFLWSISTFSPNGSIIDYVELGNIIDSAISLIGSASNYNRIIFSASDGTYIQTYNLYKVGSTLPETDPPFGSFETPINGSTVSSSIAVTGWALDESGIDSVKIYRAQGNKLVYIGDAMLVQGARPDVASAYPEYPYNTKAGWGYMMLTNFLPGGGNGTFVIHAIATDTVGKTTTLGTKTITVDNSNAVKPFGAIDTPTQGGTASGNSYVNWGWVLTPMPNSIPTDGSTINIWVDSVNLGHPSYNKYREDIANFFPGFANSDGAIGLFYLDTTPYENGVHTIQWTAMDNAGNTDGIGSRYFTIQNTGSSRVQWASTQAIMLDLPKISELPVDFSKSVRMKRGFNKQIVPRIITPNEKGVSRLSIRELERIELQLAEKESIVDGYLVSGNQLRPPPVGSTIKNGVFHWIPGPGFIGEYRLIFVIKDKNGEFTRREILIKIVPKFARNK